MNAKIVALKGELKEVTAENAKLKEVTAENATLKVEVAQLESQLKALSPSGQVLLLLFS